MAEKLTEVLDSSCVKLDVQSKKKQEVLRELSQLLEDAGRIEDAETLSLLLAEREKLSSTGIGNGIAIPHCLTDSVESTVMAIGRRRKGVRFDAADRKPVELFFLMVGPPGSDTEHLRLLSRLSRYLHDRGFHQSLLKASAPEQVIELFKKKEV